MPRSPLKLDLDNPTAQHIKSMCNHKGEALMDFQQAGVHYLLTKKKALLADDMGLGKTAQAICAASLVGGPVIIVCPSNVSFQWQKEIMSWTDTYPNDVQIISGYKKGRLSPKRWTIVTHHAIYKRKQDLPKSNIWIIDEVHYLKTPDSGRTIAVLGGWKKGSGNNRGLAEGAQYIWGLTGTPIPNRNIELLPLLWRGFNLDWARPAIYKEKYCEPTSVWVPHLRRSVEIYKGSTNNEELADNLYNTCMIRRLKAEVLPQLGAKRKFKVYLDPGDLPATHKKLFDTQYIPEEILSYLNEGSGVAVDTPEFSEFSEERHAQAIATAPLVSKYIKGLYEERADDERQKIVVFCHHPGMANAMKDACAKNKIASVLYTGEQTKKQKQDAKDRFINGDALVLFATIGAAGTGMDGLQHVANMVLFAEVSPVPGETEQAEDRLNRIGQTDSVTVLYLLVPGSMNEYLMDLNFGKAAKIEKALAGKDALDVVDQLDQELQAESMQEIIDTCKRLITLVPPNVSRVCKKISTRSHLTETQLQYAQKIVTKFRSRLR